MQLTEQPMQPRATPQLSILFAMPDPRISAGASGTPDCFADLNLDQIVAAITAGRGEYNLTPFLSMPLHDVDAVAFRHEVMRDLEEPRLLANLRAFAASMHLVRHHLAQIEKRYDERQKERWFVDAVDLYGDAVNRLVGDLSAAKLGSRGFLAFSDFAARYASSDAFLRLVKEAKRLEAELSAIRYNVFIDGPRVEVRRHQGEANYTEEVDATFARFRQGQATEYKFAFSDWLEMNHVEARILDGVVQLHQETFSALAEFRASNRDFLDATIIAFDREVQFYVAYLDYIAPLKAAGLHFCYPRVGHTRKDVHDDRGFDLALAAKLVRANAIPVCNDFHLKGPERVIVVSGPNQGGKTTFARTFGQLHYLASLGYPVPGTSARLLLPDRILSYFEREEKMTNLRGKLEDDLVRIRDLLAVATPRSIIIINEIFASTALRDAVALSRKIAAAITGLDALCVWVTFIEEIASLSEKTVSMTSTVVPDNPAQRTFKIVRRPADGLAYAISIAEKHRLTYDLIKDRIGP